MVEGDPINFHQAIQDSSSKKWIDAMNEEYKSMQDNQVWDLVPFPEGKKPIGCMWKDIRLVLLLKALLKGKTLTFQRLSLQFHRKTLLGQL